MTRVTFETATLADVLKRAAVIAPSRGEAFDKAAGIVLEVTPGEDLVVIRATNLDIFYREWTSALTVEADEAVVWRVSPLIAQVVASLPIASGSEVVLSDQEKPGTLTIMHKRTRSSWMMIPSDLYPEWDVFDPTPLTTVEDLGSKLQMVDWATADSDVPLEGVNFTGTHLLAGDRFRIAKVPMAMDASLFEYGPVTIPSKLLTQLMKQTGSVRVGATETQLQVMPSDTVQIVTGLFGVPYPNEQMQRVMDIPFDSRLGIRKSAFLEVLNRAMILATERFPLLVLFVGMSELAVMMEDAEKAQLGDVVEIPGFAQHKRMKMYFSPKNLIAALDKCPSEMVTVEYDSDGTGKLIHISDGAGYDAWVVARKGTKNEEG